VSRAVHSFTDGKLHKQHLCPCGCDCVLDREELPVWGSHNIDLSFLGSGYPLYFHYIKYCVIILGLIMITSGQFNLVSDIYGGVCQ
jgi:hypothetical protein